MLGFVFLFLILAIVAGFLGFTVLMATAAEIAIILFVIFLILFVISLILQILRSMEASIAGSFAGSTDMLGWVFLFLIFAIIAGVFGFTSIMATTAWIAKILFYVFLALFVVALIFSLFRRKM